MSGPGVKLAEGVDPPARQPARQLGPLLVQEAAGLRVLLRPGEVDLGVNAYRTRIDDLIAYQGGETFQAVNVARAAVDGLELTVQRRIDAWLLGANGLILLGLAFRTLLA